ncbi:helix-turn-helix domain-containing protein [Streptomyces sp. CB03234]|uniref:PucR family transcriptional regulator n=1 Tax=Streptomyces sp. (strain CB03234) TaxID=1703937 RepID=UPI001F5293DB|nr:PucR family transcriptional regulator [Streptomyces sp. CB03234]
MTGVDTQGLRAPAGDRSAWADLPHRQVREFADRAMAEVPALAQEILDTICREHPRMPLLVDDSGELVALVGIRRALEEFLQHLVRGSGSPQLHLEVFQDFGRGEGQQGRTLDSLQAVYRLGVRLAWRRLAEIGHEARIPPPAMYDLAEAGFAFLDGLVDQTVRGYAEAAARQAGERLRLQRKLTQALLGERRPDRSRPLEEHAAAHAARIGWTLPQRVAVGVLLRPARDCVAPAVGAEVLLDMESERPLLFVPDPAVPGRCEQLHRALRGWTGAIGPAVPLGDAAASLRWATEAMGLIERGLLPSGELLHCTEHIDALVLLPPEELIEALADRCLAPLADRGPTQRRRLAETLLAWLETRGGAPEVAARLGVHPQTVRYRMRQIKELWGDEVEDPDRRFELELVLRAQRLQGRLSLPGR